MPNGIVDVREVGSTGWVADHDRTNEVTPTAPTGITSPSAMPSTQPKMGCRAHFGRVQPGHQDRNARPIEIFPEDSQGVARVPTVEVLKFTPTTRKLIEEQEEGKLGDLIRMSGSEGMQDFTMSLVDLVKQELIDRTAAMEVAPNPDALKMGLKGIATSQPGIL